MYYKNVGCFIFFFIYKGVLQKKPYISTLNSDKNDQQLLL